jgi:hypothetical protein
VWSTVGMAVHLGFAGDAYHPEALASFDPS